MDRIKTLFATASKRYNNSLPHNEACRDLIFAAHDKLLKESSFSAFGSFSGKPVVAYNVFHAGSKPSRPIRPDLYIADLGTFRNLHEQFMQGLSKKKWNDDDIQRANRVVYTAIMSVAACYDLWQRESRKTPGTFFEIFMAGIIKQLLPSAILSKHIPLANLLRDPETAEGVEFELSSENGDDEEAASVSTDLVVKMANQTAGVVVPMKITTRERIVQPFAHQRILDSAFGEGRFKSLLLCISETQLDEKTKSVKQVCVPGTIKLFQKYLAKLGGIYYCDVPQRYVTSDMEKIVTVRSLGHFFPDVIKIFTDQETKQI